MTILRSIAVVLVASWLGAAVYFSAVVAPSAFGVLRSHGVENASELAGAIVNRSLAIINVSGFAIALLALLITLFLRTNYHRILFAIQTALLLVVVVMTGLGEWVIAARLRALRAAITVPMEQLALTDPQRVAFANLHRYSVMALGIAIIAALIGSFLLARGAQNN
jgi:ABC-type protease/lipase transport system fused ATPase/permease subunit